MYTTVQNLRNAAFETRPNGKTSKEPEVLVPQKQNENYNRARLRNAHTGKLQEILLVDLQCAEVEISKRDARIDGVELGGIRDRLLVESQPELKLDVRRVLREFSPIEQRVLHRVYVQGMSVEIACKRMKNSAMYWRQWLAVIAIPKLRKALGDYYQDGKVVL